MRKKSSILCPGNALDSLRELIRDVRDARQCYCGELRKKQGQKCQDWILTPCPDLFDPAPNIILRYEAGYLNRFDEQRYIIIRIRGMTSFWPLF